MNLAIRVLPEARAEFHAAADWYEQQQAGLGAAFVARVRDVLQRLSANPRLHAAVCQDVRKAVGEVVIISVFHTTRDPSIWQSRA